MFVSLINHTGEHGCILHPPFCININTATIWHIFKNSIRDARTPQHSRKNNQKMGLGPTLIPLNFESNLLYITTWIQTKNSRFSIYLLLCALAEA